MSNELDTSRVIPGCTLDRFIRLTERRHREKSGAIPSGELSELLSSVALAVKIISNLVSTHGFRGLGGYTDSVNVQGEQVHQLDREADSILGELLSTSGHFGSLLSEERDSIFTSKFDRSGAKYVLAFDPLDGSSNLGTSIPVGTIFCIFRKSDPKSPASVGDYLQSGRSIVAAGYGIYGARTDFVFSSGAGVHSFSLDPAVGEFILTDENLVTPEKGKIYSVNEGNSQAWEEPLKSYISHLKAGGRDGIPGSYSLRYVGSLVADFDRNLRKGGLFLYPADSKNRKGKLRLIYECLPLAFIAEQAGGRAVDGPNNILDLTPIEIHQRTPFIVGSRADVDEFQTFTVGKR